MFEQRREDRSFCHFNLSRKKFPRLSKLLNVRTPDLFDPDFLHFSYQSCQIMRARSGRIIIFLLKWLDFLSIASSFSLSIFLFFKGTSFSSRINFSGAPRIHSSLSSCSFLSDLLTKRLLSSGKERSRDDCFIICNWARAYSRDVSSEPAAKKDAVRHFLPVAAEIMKRRQ